MSKHSISKIPKKIYHVDIPFELKQSPLDWLKEKTLYPKVFWKSKKDSKMILALGSVASFHDISEITAPLNFFTTPSHTYLPRITLSLNADGFGVLIYHYLEEEKDLCLEDFLTNKLKTSSVIENSFIDRVDLPTKNKWINLIEKALHAFDTTSLQKVVLARASYLTFSDNLCPFSLMQSLSATASNCTLFIYATSKTESFIGASPEHLYKRVERALFTEAVAGTRPRGKTQEEDNKFIQELYENDKEQKEFGYVSAFLESNLTQLCECIKKQTQKQVIQTKYLQHLYHSFEGILKSHITDKDLLQILHPTPAIGGFPRDLAKQFIKSYEPFSRGLYAAPLGWISSHSSEYIVAIRSALLSKNTMTVFAGTGIVKDSDPLKEWEELELKISPFLNIVSSYATQ